MSTPAAVLLTVLVMMLFNLVGNILLIWWISRKL
jgi:hypothetical protein